MGSSSWLRTFANRGLFRVRHSGIEPAGQATWIGDSDAFEFYQQLYHGMPKPQVFRSCR